MSTNERETIGTANTKAGCAAPSASGQSVNKRYAVGAPKSVDCTQPAAGNLKQGTGLMCLMFGHSASPWHICAVSWPSRAIRIPFRNPTCPSGPHATEPPFEFG